MDKALLIRGAKTSFAMFLMAKLIPFRFDYPEFIIENTANADTFRTFCVKNGVPQNDIDAMTFEIVKIDRTVRYI